MAGPGGGGPTPVPNPNDQRYGKLENGAGSGHGGPRANMHSIHKKTINTVKREAKHVRRATGGR